MYHIWAVQCQIQLDAGKCRRSPRFRAISPPFCGARRPPACACRRPPHRRRGSAPGCRPRRSPPRPWRNPPTTSAGLAGDRQRIERGAFQQPFGLSRQIGGDPHVALEAAGKTLRLTASSMRAGRGDPDAAAGQLALDVGHGLAVRADHEADHFLDRLERAGKRAMRSVPGATLVAPRSSSLSCAVASILVSRS